MLLICRTNFRIQRRICEQAAPHSGELDTTHEKQTITTKLHQIEQSLGNISVADSIVVYQSEA